MFMVFTIFAWDHVNRIGQVESLDYRRNEFTAKAMR